MALTNVHGVNTPPIVDFKLPKGCPCTWERKAWAEGAQSGPSLHLNLSMNIPSPSYTQEVTRVPEIFQARMSE